MHIVIQGFNNTEVVVNHEDIVLEKLEASESVRAARTLRAMGVNLSNEVDMVRVREVEAESLREDISEEQRYSGIDRVIGGSEDDSSSEDIDENSRNPNVFDNGGIMRGSR